MLILDNPSTWPLHIIKQLNKKAMKNLLKSQNSIDRLIDDFDLRSIFVDVQEYAESEGIAGYHCTKQLPEKPFTKTGLRILDIKTHHKEFLEMISNKKLVDDKLFNRIEKALSVWRVGEENRENQLWFCLTRSIVLEPAGTELLFKYYGGEAIYMPFIYEPEMKDVADLLERIGEPVIVEAKLSASTLILYSEYSLGKSLVSYFAKSINPEFLVEDRESHIYSDVPPGDIVAVYPYKLFAKTLFPFQNDNQ